MKNNDSTVQQVNDSTPDIRPVDFSTGSDVVIRVDNLSKKYLIGHQRQAGHTNFRDVLTDGAKNLARKLLHPFNNSTIQRFNDSTEEFYALKDVSFEIKRGDRVGIIGRNGAGKSTLLKILSRITEPTSGRIEIEGRVASLLEVGTGFHQELTGRENIFLNGAILGMTREEIRRKFDEIVAFSEIEKFLDTPVKRYSSGMYVRLAFAVAAHLEPEILIVDEVLAVGDAQFQKKCLGKMEEVGREGRTVLFVSHNMAAVKALCSKAMLLDAGKTSLISDTSEIVNRYFLIIPNAKEVELGQREDRSGTGEALFQSIKVMDKEGRYLNLLVSGNSYRIRLGYLAKKELLNANFKISIYNLSDHMLCHFSSAMFTEELIIKPGIGFVECEINKLPLSEGNYKINIGLVSSGEIVDHVLGAYSFTVISSDYFKTGVNVKNIKDTCLSEHRWIL